MYLEYFQLTEPPFSIAPNPRYLFLGNKHQEALAHLIYGLRGEGGIVVLTGEVGTGKTTISRKLLEDIPQNTDIAWIINPRLSALELLATICDELHISYDKASPGIKGFTDCISQALLKAHAAGRNTVLMIDEAQNLSPEVLEQLRLLTNLETSERKLLQIVLLGQDELKDMLGRHDMRQFAQRITARYELKPLTEAETRAYIAHRLKVAGCTRSLFGRPEARLVHRFSQGIPRLINLICDRALLGAFSEEQARVNCRHVRQAAREVLGESGAHGRPLRPVLIALSLSAGIAAAAWLGLRFMHSAGPDVQAAATQAASTAQPSGETDAKRQAPSGAAARPQQHARPEAQAKPTQDWHASWNEIASLGQRKTALATLLHAWLPRAEPPHAESFCNAMAAYRLQCLRLQTSLGQLRRLDRPAVIRLNLGGRDAHAVLRQLDGDRAWLQIDEHRWQIPIPALLQRWYAEALILWRTPPGYRDTIRPGHRGEAVDWLVKSLDVVQGRMIPPHLSTSMDAVLVSRVRDFQRQQGLQPDGAAGPQTLMRLNDALQLDRPHLKDSGGQH